MVASPRAVALLLALACLPSVGCSEDATGGDGPQDAGAEDEPFEFIERPPYVTPPTPPEPPIERTYAPTLTAVYGEILAPTCALDFCHNSNGSGVNFVTQEEAYRSLVGQPSTTFYCAKLGHDRVVPGEPDESLLYLKIAPDPPCGVRMPACYGCEKVLEPPVIEQIRQWIALGAPND